MWVLCTWSNNHLTTSYMFDDGAKYAKYETGWWCGYNIYIGLYAYPNDIQRGHCGCISIFRFQISILFPLIVLQHVHGIFLPWGTDDLNSCLCAVTISTLFLGPSLACLGSILFACRPSRSILWTADDERGTRSFKNLNVSLSCFFSFSFCPL